MRIDTTLPVAVFESPNISGVGYLKYGIGLHSIECPLGPSWAEALGGMAYMQNPNSKVSVTYITDADSIANTAQEDAWTWSAGKYANKPFIHVEQAGYASFSRPQWLGDPSAIGTTYQRPDGSIHVYTAQDAAWARSQMRLLAMLIADIAKRHGWRLVEFTKAELIAASRGEFTEGGITQHSNISDWLGATTHWDAGPGYPMDVLLSMANAINNPPAPPPLPTPTPPLEDTVMNAAQEAKLDRALAFATRAARDAAITRKHVARVFVKGQSTFAGSVAAVDRALVEAAGANVTVV